MQMKLYPKKLKPKIDNDDHKHFKVIQRKDKSTYLLEVDNG